MEGSEQGEQGTSGAADVGRDQTTQALWAVVRRSDSILEGMGVGGNDTIWSLYSSRHTTSFPCHPVDISSMALVTSPPPPFLLPQPSVMHHSLSPAVPSS